MLCYIYIFEDTYGWKPKTPESVYPERVDENMSRAVRTYACRRCLAWNLWESFSIHTFLCALFLRIRILECWDWCLRYLTPTSQSHNFNVIRHFEEELEGLNVFIILFNIYVVPFILWIRMNTLIMY